ncbi:FkbM family methyltransferase [Streptomyces sp. NBC_01217]|uniref:FkbM family methyltransferase n=1 Tax=Streptomyces sp. NBC_01217 TaxID=2903779 RepID=UPI002E0EE369|nr:FkbM family methyltransferase [Streptomyces sp. NBC_01217]
MSRMIWDHPANRGRRAQAFAAMAGWQAWKRMVGRPMDLSVYDGMSFRAYPDSTQPGRFVYFGGLPDYEEMTFMKRYLRPGDGFIDGGANEGMFTLLAAKLVGSSGAVHAFEAVPAFAKRLRENVRANSLRCVTVHEMAIGAEPGTVPFVVRGSGSRIRTEADSGSSVQVRLGRLDDTLPERPFAMGKLDVEGTEHLALRGADRLVAHGEPAVWMLELVDKFLHHFGSTVREVRWWLDDHGYDVVLYDPDHNRLVPAPDPLSAGPDVLAVCRRRRRDVEARLAEAV